MTKREEYIDARESLENLRYKRDVIREYNENDPELPSIKAAIYRMVNKVYKLEKLITNNERIRSYLQSTWRV